MKPRPLLTGFSQERVKKAEKLGLEAEAASKLQQPFFDQARLDVLAQVLR
ncbi:hypothetical protein [Mesorhizobium sp. WSM4884]|nr:hypothetical protein [Mesorhizobium sp. WSM4884]MDG4885606.1 hypothetical protein [Mesorhizobium sp. WSM4884]